MDGDGCMARAILGKLRPTTVGPVFRTDGGDYIWLVKAFLMLSATLIHSASFTDWILSISAFSAILHQNFLFYL